MAPYPVSGASPRLLVLHLPHRSLVVPSIMGLLGRWAWWPRKLRPVQFDAICTIPDSKLLPGPCQGRPGPGTSEYLVAHDMELSLPIA